MIPKETELVLRRFCQIAFWEGVSFIVLLFVAMPLKYFADLPMAVKLVGWAHGVLFILYAVYLLLSFRKADWSIVKTAILFLASLVPFAAFFAERSVKAELKSEAAN